MTTRRTFLRSLAALPLIGGWLAVMGKTAVAAPGPVVPVVTNTSDELLDRYITFLAHEHRAALKERHFGWRDFTAERPQPLMPMFWFPDAPDIEAMVEAKPPSSRAVVCLAAFDPDWKQLKVMIERAKG